MTLAGVAPDMDGLSLLGGQDAYSHWHHLLTHGYVAATVTAALCAAFSRERLRTGLLALGAFHLHLLCDLTGSGRDWPLYYFWPTGRAAWLWSHGWELASWQNSVIGMAVTGAALAMALWTRRTPVELFSVRADRQVVAALRARFLGEPLPPPPPRA